MKKHEGNMKKYVDIMQLVAPIEALGLGKILGSPPIQAVGLGRISIFLFI